MINDKMFALGSKRSVIREIFEYSKKRSAEIGKDRVFDFSIGNPSVPAPKAVNKTVAKLLRQMDSVALHGYTSAQGDASGGGSCLLAKQALQYRLLRRQYLYDVGAAACGFRFALRRFVKRVTNLSLSPRSSTNIPSL